MIKRTKLSLLSLFLIFSSVTVSAFALSGNGKTNFAGEYRIHLYFGDSSPFIDDLKLEASQNGTLSGSMHVPNDFDGSLENIQISDTSLSFDILVPKNKSRPVDLVFRYESLIFSPELNQFAGFVKTINEDGKPLSKMPYTASFLMFRKKP